MCVILWQLTDSETVKNTCPAKDNNVECILEKKVETTFVPLPRCPRKKQKSSMCSLCQKSVLRPQTLLILLHLACRISPLWPFLDDRHSVVKITTWQSIVAEDFVFALPSGRQPVTAVDKREIRLAHLITKHINDLASDTAPADNNQPSR